MTSSGSAGSDLESDKLAERLRARGNKNHFVLRGWLDADSKPSELLLTPDGSIRIRFSRAAIIHQERPVGASPPSVVILDKSADFELVYRETHQGHFLTGAVADLFRKKKPSQWHGQPPTVRGGGGAPDTADSVGEGICPGSPGSAVCCSIGG